MSYSRLRYLFPIFVTMIFVFSFLNLSDIFFQGNLSSQPENEDTDIMIVPSFSNFSVSEDSTVLSTQFTIATSNPAFTIKTLSPSTNEQTSPFKPIEYRKVTLTRMGTRGTPFADFRPITYYSENDIDEAERRAYWDSFGSDKLNQSDCYHSLSLSVPSGRNGISVRFATPGPGIGMNLNHLANSIIYARHYNYTIFFLSTHDYDKKNPALFQKRLLQNLFEEQFMITQNDTSCLNFFEKTCIKREGECYGGYQFCFRKIHLLFF